MARIASPKIAPKRVTIHEIAREAEVSIGTVSRALNNAYGVNPETRDKILEVSRRLGMRPRHSGRLLHFAVVVPDHQTVTGTYTPMLIYEIVHRIAARDIALTILPESQLEKIGQRIYDGVLAIAFGSLETLATLHHTPVVVVNRFSEKQRFHVVGWNHVAEGRAVAQYLADHGHRRPAFVAFGPANEASQLRLEGFRVGCRANGIELPAERIEWIGTRSVLGGAVKRALDSQADAIFLPGESLAAEALGVLQYLMGVKVPDQVSVIGGENPGWSEVLNPPLTTIQSPIPELAEHVVDHLLALVEHRRKKPVEVLVATRIIERKSVRDRRTASAG